MDVKWYAFHLTRRKNDSVFSTKHFKYSFDGTIGMFLVEYPRLTGSILIRRVLNSKGGHTAGEFKTRYNGHTSPFRSSKYKHATELSKFVWHLKDRNIKYSIKWRILAKCNSYSNKTKRCQLCLHEKFLIIYQPNLASLNSRH